MRLFLALELPPPVLEELGRCRRMLESRHRGWRWVDPGGLHVTLRFVGSVPGEVVGPLRAIGRDAARAARRCALALDLCGTFPPRGRPRVLWVGVLDREPGRLRALVESLEHGCRGLGLAADRRPYHAHVTLARARRERQVERPAPDTGPEPLEFVVDVLTLFESRLSPSGASYRVVERFPLEGV